MDTAQIIIAILGAGTVGTILTSIVNGLVKYVTGSAGRERTRNADMRTQRNEAWQDAERERNRADREARNRGIISEAFSRARRMLIEAPCVDESKIPPYPELEQEPPAN